LNNYNINCTLTFLCVVKDNQNDQLTTDVMRFNTQYPAEYTHYVAE